jgi:uncharacterized protein
MFKKYKKLLALVFALVFLGIFLIIGYLANWGQTAKIDYNTLDFVKINETIIPVELADNNLTRRLGLSNRESLDEDKGMLFIMPSRGLASFWMKDMNFPLDIIWIDGSKIVNLSSNLPPAGSEPDVSYSSIHPINYVLEVNAGFIEENNIKVGDTVFFNINK